MKLRDLLPEAAPDSRLDGIEVVGVTSDSRKVKPGFLFVAIAGNKTDGALFVKQAASDGAVAVIAEQRPDTLPDAMAFIRAANPRRLLALAAAKIFPRQPATIAAVTGTSGKTSVAAFTRQIWSEMGYCAASIGTVGVVSPGGERYGSLTTPDPVELHRTLDRLAKQGVTHLALEASSHGLDQHRLDGVCIAAGAFTNLSRDHLDYHPSIEAYLAAKLRLFEELIVPGGTAVIGVDDCNAHRVAEAAKNATLKSSPSESRGPTLSSSARRSMASIRSSRLCMWDARTKCVCHLSGRSRCRMRELRRDWRSQLVLSPRVRLRPWKNLWAPRAGLSSLARARARRFSSTMPTNQMRWPRRSRHCALTPPTAL